MNSIRDRKYFVVKGGKDVEDDDVAGCDGKFVVVYVKMSSLHGVYNAFRSISWDLTRIRG